MATIQVRDVPDDVHRVYRERSAAAGMSLQEYLRAQLVTVARRRTPAEVAGEVGRRLQVERPVGFTDRSTADLVREDREDRDT